MATKKTAGVRTPKPTEKQTTATTPVAESERPQYKIPYVSARIDRMATDPNSKIRANASVTIGNHFAIHGFKVYDGGEKGLQVLYPGHRGSDNNFYEDFHPITKEGRETLNKYVLEAYEQNLEQAQAEEQGEDLDEDEDQAFEQTMQAYLLNNR